MWFVLHIFTKSVNMYGCTYRSSKWVQYTTESATTRPEPCADSVPVPGPAEVHAEHHTPENSST